MRVENRLFVDSVFSGWSELTKGNAVLSRWDFAGLGDSAKSGAPRNIPIYQTPLYRGARDTEPRYALISRISRAPFYPFVVGVHLTTLRAERAHVQDAATFSKEAVEEAQIIRLKQAKRLLDLLKRHVLEQREFVFLLGDFNAVAREPCIRFVLESEGGFVRLRPSGERTSTHSTAPGIIDHILVYPQDRVLDYECRIVDSEIARESSDHLPVVADVWIG
jgi:endonuclease/exonuclease/phosphatase family metal-dependent hydrolase